MNEDYAVVVTGAGSGIGRGIAVAFSERGAKVLAVGRRREALEHTAGLAPGIVPFAADVREEPEAIIAAARERFGRIDALINNAGVFAAFRLADTDAAKLEQLWSTNVTATSLLARHALDDLERSAGAIVNISSTFGHRPAPEASHYGASKAAVEQLTRSWALELAPRRIRVNAVAPGPVESEALAAAGLPPETVDAVKKDEAAAIPLGRRGTPAETAAWVLHFAAADWVTGQVVTVDGGLELI